MVKQTHPSSHPPLPPTREDEHVSWLRLLRSRRVGPATFYRLLAEHGCASAALEALPDVAKAAGVDDYEVCSAERARAERDVGLRSGAQMICIGDPHYPSALAHIPDAPPIVWAKGQLDMLDRPLVAVVGARNASSLGQRMARALATELSKQGYGIVSGLARGIDTVAHTASLETGTIAVHAGGLDIIYPAENTQLGESIPAKGLRLSERPFGLTPRARDFPRRNRIISGLSQAVIVVEAAAKSGSLITARNALDQGRDVLAVPGHPLDPRSSGCNLLIRDGARLVRNADDVIEALSDQSTPDQLPLFEPTCAPAPAQTPPKQSAQTERRSLRDTAELHTQILNRLGPTPLAEDQLIRDLAVSAQNVSPALTDLELEGRIERHPGGLLALAT
ncbi:MAG: DNA-processing protein DprA [Thalassovita sp.]